ncbi:hypothetical protein L195_g060340, partial [Trifolium pratense]
ASSVTSDMIHIREGPVESWGICAYEADKSLSTVRSARLRSNFLQHEYDLHRGVLHTCVGRATASGLKILKASTQNFEIL